MDAAELDARLLRELPDEELRVRALDEALYAPGRLGEPWPPAIRETVARRAGKRR